MTDSIKIGELYNNTGIPSVELPTEGYKPSLKNLIILFIIFLFIVSDIFMNNVLMKINGATVCCETTVYGSVIQGVFLVLMYAGASYLSKNKIL